MRVHLLLCVCPGLAFKARRGILEGPGNRASGPGLMGNTRPHQASTVPRDARSGTQPGKLILPWVVMSQVEKGFKMSGAKGKKTVGRGRSAK